MKKVLLLMLIALSACSGNSNRAFARSFQDSMQETVDNNSIVETLPIPEVPANITAKEDKLAYVIAHFWDSLDFNDTVRTYNQAFIEQNFANFAYILQNVGDYDKKKAAVENLLNRAAINPHSFKIIREVADDYLYDPNSPMLNEESYIPFLEILSQSSLVDEAQKSRYSYLLECAQKNRPGMVAADFSFIDRKGNKSSLHSFNSQGDILLIFYDPDCESCKTIIKELSDNQRIKEEIRAKRLSVLAIYSGEDKSLWQSTADKLPQEWAVGYEPGQIDEKELYDFRAFPTLYILDKNKRVVKKDIPASQL